jgi:hypothetical protein
LGRGRAEAEPRRWVSIPPLDHDGQAVRGFLPESLLSKSIAPAELAYVDVKVKAELDEAGRRMWANLHPGQEWLRDWEYVSLEALHENLRNLV